MRDEGDGLRVAAHRTFYCWASRGGAVCVWAKHVSHVTEDVGGQDKKNLKKTEKGFSSLDGSHQRCGKGVRGIVIIGAEVAVIFYYNHHAFPYDKLS